VNPQNRHVEVVSEPSKRLSYHELLPNEIGGVNARAGFHYQDHVAVGFLLEMLENNNLLEVWCESHDDITLVWNGENSEEFEFVQVKDIQHSTFWSVAKLCEREAGELGTSILERSLQHDCGLEPCRFRIVTSLPTNKDLSVLNFPLDAPVRQNTKDFETLLTAVEQRVSDFFSDNGNDFRFWLSRTLWEIRQSIESIKDKNLLCIYGMSDKEGLFVSKDQCAEIYKKILYLAQEAALVSPKKDLNAKRITQERLRTYLLSLLQEAAHPQRNIKGDMLEPVRVMTTGRFVGREAELKELQNIFFPVNQDQSFSIAYSVHGMAGLGKSWLVEEFFQINNTVFQRLLTVVLEASQNNMPTLQDLLGRLVDQFNGVSIANLQKELRKQNVLVHLENVDNEQLADVASQLADHIQGVALVITGRYAGFADIAHWKTISLSPFNEMESLDQFERELNPDMKLLIKEGERLELVQTLGGLPLALHLAARQINRGIVVAEFLKNLKDKGFDARLAPNDSDYVNRTERTLKAVFDGSLELLAREIVALDVSIDAVYHLGLAPRAGFGLGLGSVLTGLKQKTNDVFVIAAELSVIEKVLVHERQTVIWRVHPLLAEHLKRKLSNELIAQTLQSFADWVLERLKDRTLWRELSQERLGLIEWLAGLTPDMASNAIIHGFDFSRTNGPYQAWLSAGKLAQTATLNNIQRLATLRSIGYIAIHADEHDIVFQCIEEMSKISTREDISGFLLTTELQADFYLSRDDFDVTLRILDQRLSVLENPNWKPKFDNEIADAKTKKADIYKKQGRIKESIDLIEGESMPFYKKINDTYMIAHSLGIIADNYWTQAGNLKNQGEYNSAAELLSSIISIRRDEILPIFEVLQENRSVAITKGKIADVYEIQGDIFQVTENYQKANEKYNDALNIRLNDELIVYGVLEDGVSERETQSKISRIRECQKILKEKSRSA
jgi:tetratricopeptide (TPR) repeat protein